MVSIPPCVARGVTIGSEQDARALSGVYRPPEKMNATLLFSAATHRMY